MKVSKFYSYALLSTMATSMVFIYAYQTRIQFYPMIIYLVTSKFCLLILSNMCLMMTLLMGRVITFVIFGHLRDREIETLYEKSRYAITETGLALTIFRSELTAKSLSLCTMLLFVKCFHWLCQLRVEYVEQSDNVSKWQHMKLIFLMGLLLLIDVSFVAICIMIWSGPNVLILFGFEYTILSVLIFSSVVKYALHMIDTQIEGNWPQKMSYMFFLEFVTEFIKFFSYVIFFTIIFMHYGIPFHIIRDLYNSYNSLKNKLILFKKYRELTSNMNERFPDATVEELEGKECIICRDQMETAKKLPCGHVFHTECLRLWLHHSSICPLCREEIPSTSNHAQRTAAAAARVANLDNNNNNNNNNNQQQPDAVPNTPPPNVQQQQQPNQNQQPHMHPHQHPHMHPHPHMHQFGQHQYPFGQPPQQSPARYQQQQQQQQTTPQVVQPEERDPLLGGGQEMNNNSTPATPQQPQRTPPRSHQQSQGINEPSIGFNVPPQSSAFTPSQMSIPGTPAGINLTPNVMNMMGGQQQQQQQQQYGMYPPVQSNYGMYPPNPYFGMNMMGSTAPNGMGMMQPPMFMPGFSQPPMMGGMGMPPMMGGISPMGMGMMGGMGMPPMGMGMGMGMMGGMGMPPMGGGSISQFNNNDDNITWYQVISTNGIIVRSELSLESQIIRIIPMGSIIMTTESVEVTTPQENYHHLKVEDGWISDMVDGTVVIVRYKLPNEFQKFFGNNNNNNNNEPTSNNTTINPGTTNDEANVTSVRAPEELENRKPTASLSSSLIMEGNGITTNSTTIAEETYERKESDIQETESELITIQEQNIDNNDNNNDSRSELRRRRLDAMERSNSVGGSK